MRTALAELAARYLQENNGEVMDDDQAFVRLFDAIKDAPLPAAVRQPLLSLRANIARRRDEPYRSYYDAQGCVRRWQVGAIEGSMEAFELRRAQVADTFPSDPKAVVTPLACVVRVWNDTRHTGFRRMRSYLDVPGNLLELNLGSQASVRVYLDGRLIHRSDRSDRWVRSDTNLRLEVAPGLHRLDVHAVFPRESTWVLVRATDHRGQAVPAHAAVPKGASVAAAFSGPLRYPGSPYMQGLTGPLAEPSFAPLRLYLAAADAMADGNSDDAEGFTRALRQKGPEFAEGHLLRAAFEIGDPSRERGASVARQRAAIERALAIAPELDQGRVRLLEMGLERGETTEVIEALDALPPDALTHVAGELLRYHAYMARGNEFLADAALARAAAKNPEHCGVLKAQRGVAQRRGDVAQEDALSAKVEHCPGTTGTRARLAARRGRHDDARNLFNKLLDRTPDDLEILGELADLAIQQDRFDEALRLRREILRISPSQIGMHVGIADLQAHMGDPAAARTSVGTALQKIPHSMTLRRVAEGLGIPDDMHALRVEGSPIIAAYQADKREHTGVSEVLVLDRSAARVYPDGSQRHIVHTITELRSKEAIDRYGEVDPGDGVQVLTLHTIKPDGRIFEPERIPEKDGLSLRGLQIGDFVEYEFMYERSELGLLPGYIDLSTFRFQSAEIPFYISEMIVAHPTTMPLKAEVRVGAPAATVRRDGDVTIQTWRVERSPRLGVEPQMRHYLYEVPSVRVYNDVTPEVWLEALGVRLYTMLRGNLELRQRSRQLVAGKRDGLEKLTALHRWVVENIEEVGDLQVPATLTLSARRGGGLILLRSMLREVGIRAELWIARDNYGPALIPGGNPLYETYDAPYLAVWPTADPEPIMVTTGSKVMPLGYLPPGLSKAQAMRIPLTEGERSPSVVQLPARPTDLIDRRIYKVSLELGRDGSGRVEGSLELHGMEAAAWRDVLRQIDRDRLDAGFERAELAALFPGATVELADLKIEGEKDVQAPLRLVFQGGIRGAVVVQDGELLLRAAMVPVNVGLGYASLPTRKTGYHIPFAPELDAEVTIQIAGAKFRGKPSNETIETPHGTYRRTVEGDATKMIVRSEATLQTGVFGPEAYPGLAAMTRQIKAAEDQVIRAR